MKLTVAIAITFHLLAVDAALRQSADRVRNVHSASPWKSFQAEQGSANVIDELKKQAEALEAEEAAILELVEAMEAEFAAASSLAPTASPSPLVTASPTNFTESPTPSPTNFTDFPTASPTNQTASPTVESASPSISVQPSSNPTVVPVESASPTVSSSPSGSPTILPTISVAPSSTPTLAGCGVTPEQREAVILGILDQVADSALIRDVSTPQGRATRWIISEDERVLCPDDPDIIQRWTMAVMYYSTEGNAWTQCFQGDLECGTSVPFLSKVSFLSPTSECQWAGVSCNSMGRVTEIEYEDNNLVGTIPTELGLLSQLVIWGMERGNLTGTIPSEIGSLRNLIFIDLDFNQLTGSLPTELYQLVNLTQLDLNNNNLGGPISGLGAFTRLEFLQLHSNSFTGTVPEAVGTFTRLSTFTLHESDLSGSVPIGLCDIVDSGILTSLIADCGADTPEITCECCTDCRI